ncbi:ketopantoate reductase family protein [Terrimonas ferruginea]|uniref:ketopantoate reductase family protein n=1 Tax=Terrimonas ferruginea TaxID=249 RepID=UPI00041C54F3|nr:ketopantoate reductase C-terminal domain-containing protein [Terrimonas ferruginea]
MNSVFNSVCPLLETDNGIFHRNVAALEIARTVIAECIAVARTQGISLTASEVEESLLKISKLSDGQLISTYQDILAGRRTEIDTLNFEIVRMAGNVNVSNTKLLGELVRLKADMSGGII